jgi:hypothetical protein
MKKGRGIKDNHRAQMQISFSLIFSIILIIVFIAFAFFGIKKFLEIQNSLKSETLMDELQKDIDDLWKSSSGLQKISYNVPKGTEAFCLEPQIPDSEDDNAYFIPSEYGGRVLEHIDWVKTIEGTSGRLCFEPRYGKITLTLEKDYDGENQVIIKNVPD